MLLLIETLTNAPVIPMQHASMVVVGVVGAVGSLVSGIIGMSSAKKAGRDAARDAAARQAELNALEKNRQAVINPYAGVKDLSGLAKDLSGMVSNPYANLGVATQAAKFQAEQTDMSLASTLDTLKETGASAGGATALAQAALQAKQGISASIEQQEAANEKLKAQGQQQLEQIQMSEAGRIQGIQMSEAGRMQEAEVAGKQFVFGAQESREVAKMDRVAGQLSGAQARQAQARSDSTAALTGMIGGITSAVGAAVGAGAGAGAGTGAKAGTNTGQFKASNFDVPMTRPGSDRRLKKNITHIGISTSGLNIYSFEYKDEKFGDGLWQGVMSDEIPVTAVIKHEDGFDRVDYSLLDVEFKQI